MRFNEFGRSKDMPAFSSRRPERIQRGWPRRGAKIREKRNGLAGLFSVTSCAFLWQEIVEPSGRRPGRIQKGWPRRGAKRREKKKSDWLGFFVTSCAFLWLGIVETSGRRPGRIWRGGPRRGAKIREKTKWIGWGFAYLEAGSEPSGWIARQAAPMMPASFRI